MRPLVSNGCMIPRPRSRAKTTPGVGAFKPELQPFGFAQGRPWSPLARDSSTGGGAQMSACPTPLSMLRPSWRVGWNVCHNSEGVERRSATDRLH